MSYGFPQEPRRKRAAGGGGLMFLIILGLGAFFLFRSANRGGATAPEQDRGADRSGRFDPLENASADSRFDPPPERHEDASDWDMESVDVNKKTSPRETESTDATQAGDWSMEQVPANDKKDDTNFKFSNEQKPDAPKSTENGDWSSEEIPVKGGGGN